MAPASFHAAMFPWLAMGHMIPYIHLANQLAARGHKVSILVPKATLRKLQQRTVNNRSKNLITFHPLTLPHVDGIPLGAETASDIPQSSTPLLAVAMDLMRDQVEAVLKVTKPDLVFYDFAHYTPEIAMQLGIKSVCYQLVSPTALGFSFVPARHVYVPTDREMTEEEAKQPPPGFPSSPGGFVLEGHELLSMPILQVPFGHGGNITFFERMKTAMQNCDALALRSFRELEGKFCDYLSTQFRKPVLLTGSVLLPEEEEEEENKTTELEDPWAKWLDAFEPGSVVFCAFGSEYVFEKDQFQELLLGFEQTGWPFLLALRPPKGCTAVEEAFADGFEEKVKGRGVVHGGWVQQPLILNHASVGCFVGHSGFGSLLESLMSDKQIVLVPQLGDQVFNTRLLVDELKVAVKVDRDDNGWFSNESLCKAIKSVMDKDSQVGIMVSNSHAQLKDVFTKPGFITGYIDNFVEHLQQVLIH